MSLLKKIAFGIALIGWIVVSGQTPTWSGGIADLVYKNCSSCHRSGGPAPFSLLSYGQAFNNRSRMKTVINERIMPPWPPDVNYSKHAYSRALSERDIILFNNWVDGGAPSGDLAKAPLPPNFDNLGEIKNPDLTITMPSYTVSNTQDEYRCFPDSTRLKKDMWMTALECEPGNSEIVHHVLIFMDKGNRAYTLDNREAGPGYLCFGGPGTPDYTLLAAWVPGSRAFTLPKGFGMKIPAGSNIIMQVHYPGGTKGKLDKTKVKLKLTEIPQRETFFVPVLNHALNMTNGPLVIPANTVKTFNQRFPVPFNVSLIGVAPHMHLIGTKIKVWATDPTNKEIPLVSIPHWDFHWQGMYQFPKILKLNLGSTLHAEAVYDNTTNNHHNPNDPPKEVREGEATTDEMMLNYFLFSQYLPGDENIIIDSAAALISAIGDERLPVRSIQVLTNPMRPEEKIKLQYTADALDQIGVSIYDLQGKILHQERFSEALPGHHIYEVQNGSLSRGMYVLKVIGKKWQGTLKVVVNE